MATRILAQELEEDPRNWAVMCVLAAFIAWENTDAIHVMEWIEEAMAGLRTVPNATMQEIDEAGDRAVELLNTPRIKQHLNNYYAGQEAEKTARH